MFRAQFQCVTNPACEALCWGLRPGYKGGKKGSGSKKGPGGKKGPGKHPVDSKAVEANEADAT